MMRMTTMPAAFIGHGSPMNALDTNRYTEAWAAFGAAVPTPRAIVAISAHWFINATAVTAMAAPQTIHDFFGFPEELFAVRYPAPGDPALAEELAEVVKPTWVGQDRDSWGLDHGTWSVLVHAFPEADVPVVQLSIDASKPLDYHVALGAAARPAARRGRAVRRQRQRRAQPAGHPTGRLAEEGFDWAHRFDDAARELMTDRTRRHRRARRAPRLRQRGADARPLPAAAVRRRARRRRGQAGRRAGDGYAYGSLSMTAYTVG